MSMPEITPALPGDAAALALLLSRDPDANGCALRPPSPAWKGGHVSHGDEPLAYLRRRIALGGVRIARTNGRPAGFIDRTGDDILSLYIAPDARRRGLGRALVAEAKEASARLTHRSVAADTATRAFWAAQGFATAPGQTTSDIRLIWRLI